MLDVPVKREKPQMSDMAKSQQERTGMDDQPAWLWEKPGQSSWIARQHRGGL